MPIFLYHSKDILGVPHQGEIESGDVHSVVLILRKKGLIVISVVPKTNPQGGFLDKFINKVNFNDVVIMTRQLATMIGAGLVLLEAVDILEEQQTNKKLKKALQDVSHDISGGLTLAQAFGKHPDIFPPIYINLVKSGEASGKLDEVMIKMADSLERDREFQSKVKGAMIYPMIVITMMFAVMIIMMVFVIPKLTALYKDSTLELPLPTKILIGTSDIFVHFWWLMLIMVIIIVTLVKRWIKTAEGRLAFDKILLKTPIVGKIITNVTLTNFNRTFGLLTAAGMPLLDSLSIVADVTDNTVFKNALKQSYNGVERGLSFSAQINNIPVFPRIVGQMIRVGEETGKLDEVFYRLADFFESESDHLVKNLTVAIEPFVLIVLGLGVAFLVISIILPIYKLTTSF